MSEFKFSCPACGQHIRCDTSFIGTKTKCPSCQNSIVIPPPPAVPLPKLSIANPHTVPLPGPEAHAAPHEVEPLPPEPVIPKTSGLAIASLVLSLSGIGVIPGIICGHLAWNQIKKNPALRGEGLASAGLIIGYFLLILGIAALIIYVVLPAVAGQG